MFSKSGMRYVFERMSAGGYQVRLNGQFICFNKTNDPAEVDKKLEEAGYNSRKDFYDVSVERSLRALRGGAQ